MSSQLRNDGSTHAAKDGKKKPPPANRQAGEKRKMPADESSAIELMRKRVQEYDAQHAGQASVAVPKNLLGEVEVSTNSSPSSSSAAGFVQPTTTSTTALAVTEHSIRLPTIFTASMVAQAQRTAALFVSLPSNIHTAPLTSFSGVTGGGGAANVDVWLRTVAVWMQANGVMKIPGEQQCILVAGYLTGPASEWWSSLDRADKKPKNMSEMDVAMHAQFQPLDATGPARHFIRTMKQGKLPLQDYFARFQAVLMHLPDMGEKDRIYDFLQGLNDQKLAGKVREADPDTLTQAVQLAVNKQGLAELHHSQQRAFASAPPGGALATVAALQDGASSASGATPWCDNDVFGADGGLSSPPAATRGFLAEVAERAAQATVNAMASGGGSGSNYNNRGGGGGGRFPPRSGEGGGYRGRGGSTAHGRGRGSSAPFSGRSNHGRKTSSDAPCHNCGQLGHWRNTCPTQRCGRCKQAGHGANSCPAPHPAAATNPQKN